jgi:uncharacterized protein (DUF433 family)
MNWLECDLIESVPGRCSGRPVVKGTRIFAETVAEDYALGSSVEEIHENFPSLSIETIEALIAFARSPQETAV